MNQWSRRWYFFSCSCLSWDMLLKVGYFMSDLLTEIPGRKHCHIIRRRFWNVAKCVWHSVHACAIPLNVKKAACRYGGQWYVITLFLRSLSSLGCCLWKISGFKISKLGALVTVRRASKWAQKSLRHRRRFKIPRGFHPHFTVKSFLKAGSVLFSQVWSLVRASSRKHFIFYSNTPHINVSTPSQPKSYTWKQL